MPLEIEPKKGETKNEFVSRCAYKDKQMKKEYKDVRQREAICYEKWKNRGKSNG